jgi:hypothetical protein
MIIAHFWSIASRTLAIALAVLMAAMAAACSNVPIVDDVTPYSTGEIVQKVVCEAREAVSAFGEQHGFPARRIELARASAMIGQRASTLQRNNNTVANDIALLAALKVEADSNETTYDAARRTLEVLRLDVLRLKSHLREPTAGDDGAIKELEARALLAISNFKTARFTRDQTDRVREPLMQAIVSYQDEKHRILNLCANRDEAFKPLLIFDTSDVAMQFDFDITEMNNGTSAADFDWSTNVGSVSLKNSLSDDRKRRNESKKILTQLFGELISKNCSDFPTGTNNRARRYPISGSTGMADLTASFLKATENSQIVTGTKFHEALTFTTTINGMTAPSVTFQTLPGPNVTLEFPEATPLLGQRADKHVVTTDFGVGTAAQACPTSMLLPGG